jgi:hypothetical protein
MSSGKADVVVVGAGGMYLVVGVPVRDLVDEPIA